MIHDPITLPATARLREAMQIMKEYGIGGIPVLNKDRVLIGICTNRDLRFEKDPDRLITEVMTKENLITTTGVKNLKEAEQILQNYKIEKLPVIDKKGQIDRIDNL